jgi:hypothetical protein
MGEGSARTFRGAEMDDVIFTGTATRSGLDQAEVAITLEGNNFPAPTHSLETVQVIPRTGSRQPPRQPTPTRAGQAQPRLWRRRPPAQRSGSAGIEIASSASPASGVPEAARSPSETMPASLP